MKTKNRARKTLDYIYLPPMDQIPFEEVESFVLRYCFYSVKFRAFFYGKPNLFNNEWNFYRLDKNFEIFKDEIIEETIEQVRNSKWGPKKVTVTKNVLKNMHWLDSFDPYYNCNGTELDQLLIDEQLTRDFDFRINFKLEGRRGAQIRTYSASVKKIKLNKD